MIRSRTLLGGAVVAAVVALAAACGGSGNSNSDQSGPIKVVVEGPMSGDQASNGTDMFRGASLAADEANAQGGVLGHRIALIRGDDKADPATGKQVAKRAIDDHAFAVIGPYNSSVGIENLKMYINAGIIPIHLTSSAATDGLGYTIQPKVYQEAPVEAKAIKGFFGAHRVAIVYDTSAYTAGNAKQLRDLLRREGVQVVLFQPFSEGSLNAAALVGKVKAANPDLLYSATYFPEGGAIAKHAAAAGLQATCLTGLANQDPKFVGVAGLTAARRCYSSGVPSAQQFTAARKYVVDYRKKFGIEPGTWGTFTYDSLRMLFAALRGAGAVDEQKVNDQLSNTRDYHGITGTIDINPKTGDRRVVPVVILDIDKHGDYVVDPKWARFAGFSQ